MIKRKKKSEKEKEHELFVVFEFRKNSFLKINFRKATPLKKIVAESWVDTLSLKRFTVLSKIK
jgi:hypothetical protein